MFGRPHTHRPSGGMLRNHMHTRFGGGRMRGIMYLLAAMLLTLALAIARTHWREEVLHVMHTDDAMAIRNRGAMLRRRAQDAAAVADAVAARHPITRLQCGGWVQRYAALHADILAGRRRQRYAILRSRREWENGMADRLATSLSVLLYAVLTDRAFLFDDELPGHATPLWLGLRSSFIDWRYQSPVDKGNTTRVLNWNSGAPGYSDPEDMVTLFSSGDLLGVGGDVHSVVWMAERSVVYHAYDNPSLAGALKDLGLPREISFACLFDFLYRPTEPVVEKLQPLLPAMLDSGSLKIGVQIRVGDWQLVSGHRYFFHPDEYPNFFNHFFECARQLERDASAGNSSSPVFWLVMTDTPQLRKHVAAKFPHHVLTDVMGTVEHTVKSSNPSITGFLQACAELWVFSLTDYQIITLKSGFGKVGAMLSGRPRMYTINYPMQLFNAFGLGGPAFDNRKVVTPWQFPRACREDTADELTALCSTFTGC